MMKTKLPLKVRTVLLALLCFLSLPTLVAAQNKVVVVPLGGDVSATQFNELQSNVQQLQSQLQQLQHLIPKAYGMVPVSGVTPSISSNNFTVVYDAARREYKLNFDTFRFSVIRDIAFVTVVGSCLGAVPSVTSNRGSDEMVVYFEQDNGARLPLPCAFSFLVYDI